MNGFKKIKEKLAKIPKITYLVALIFIFALASITLPSFARFEHRSPIDLDTSWDGNVATSYRRGSGTLKDPYVISDGSELAYFASMLETTNYAGVYFELGNNIVLNKGTFFYDEANGIWYEEDDVTYYVEAYEEELYLDLERQNVASKTIQILPSLTNFAGTFDGNSYTIYGAYVTSENEEVGLFTNLTGDIKNLYIDNAMVYGGSVTGGIASSAVMSEISNVSFKGYVVNKEDVKNLTQELPVSMEPIVLNENETSKNLTLETSFKENVLLGKVSNVVLTGNLHLSNASSSITLNGEEILEGDFSVSLDTSLDYSLPIVVLGETQDTFTFSNLKIVIQSQFASLGGIVGKGDGITLKNVINKGNLYGTLYTGGLIGSVIHSTSIADTYNIGTVNSLEVSAGLIGLIERNNEDVQILRSYNAGEVLGASAAGLLGNILENTGGVLLNATFDTSNTLYKINQVVHSTVNISGSYLVSGDTVMDGSVNGNFTTTTLLNLQSSSYLVSFWPFVDILTLKTAPNRVWVFEDGELPILYIDDAKNPVAEIHVGTYTWNNVGYGLDSILFDKATAFSIEEISTVHPVKEFYYKIVEADEPLRASEIESITDWVSYTKGDVIEISEEGFYIVYVKAVLPDDEVHYLNTDLLVVDLSGPQVSIQIENTSFDTYKEDLSPYFISEEVPFTITASDDYSLVANIFYTIQNESLTLEELENLEENEWNLYEESGNFSNLGNNILYVKAVDQANHVTYVNTDILAYEGYTLTSIGSGYTDNGGDLVAVTGNSMVHARFTYQSEYSYPTNATHQLLVEELLPLETRIILVDHKREKIYQYQLTDETLDYGYADSCSGDACTKYATIPFTLFTEIGTGSQEKYFQESAYSGFIDEDFTILVDFGQTENTLSSIHFSVVLGNEDTTKEIGTLINNKTINIYPNEEASVEFFASQGDTIYYNSDSITNITIHSLIQYPTYENPIIDSRFMNQSAGVMVYLSDLNGEILSKEYLQTMLFSVDNVNYYPEDNGILYLPILNSNANLAITTREANTTLASGEYLLHIRGYSSYDGKYPNVSSDNEQTIPVIVTEESIHFDYGLEVKTDEEKRILNKNDGNVTLSFDLLNTGVLTDPNIRISLYQKKELTAYNQDYQLVDLQDYVTSTLDVASPSSYYITRSAKVYDGTDESFNHYEINLDLSLMTSSGYQFVFELYDGSKKVGEIQKKYLVR